MSVRGAAWAAAIPALRCENPPGQNPPGRTARHGRFEPCGEDVGDVGPGGF
ncbi:hypothetical protein ACFV98_06495 [Streptomyces violascens]|uniref:hypothetical protein n=1 Tax=Streptomyces violascens TaxID=67381 RepID=UPI00366823CD